MSKRSPELRKAMVENLQLITALNEIGQKVDIRPILKKHGIKFKMVQGFTVSKVVEADAE